MIDLLSKNYATGYCIFSVDSVSELDKLPTTNKAGENHLAYISSCVSGSRAIVSETSDRYILNGQNKWILDKNSSWGTNMDIATSEDINNITTEFLV